MERLPSEDWVQNPHRVSSCGRLISFLCKHASATNDSEISELIFSILSFKREDSAFLKAADGEAVISRARTAHVDIVKCKCALHVQKRVTTPCILVTKRSKKAQGFKYSLLTLSSSNQLEPCFEFKLPYQLTGDVSIFNGPTVLWTHAGYVYYTSLQAGEVKQIPMQLSHSISGELPLHRGQIFILGLQNLSETSTSDQSTSQTLGYLVQNGQVFDGAVVLPYPYITITHCILVLSAEEVDGVLKAAVVAATSKQQLIYIEHGIVKDVCHLPFVQPEDIQVVDTGRSGCLFVISFHEGHVCAVWKEKFQVASHWSGVSSVHVDDFMGYGTDQMLLIFKDPDVESSSLGSFLLTDLCGISYSVRDPLLPAPNTSPVLPDNYFLTIQALESRLQSGLTVLQELQRELRVKERVLQQSLQALTDVVSEREPIITQHEQVSLSILTEVGQSSVPTVIQTQSQVFWLPMTSPSSSSSSSSFPASSFTEPPAKRSKQHNAGRNHDLNTCRLAVTAVTRLTPLLNSGCVKCHVMLHYVQRQDAFALMSSPTPAVLHCGQVALDIQSGFQTQLLNEVKEDLMSLLVMLEHWTFRIDSPDHSLGDIDSWIQNRVGCKRVEVSPEYLLLNSSGPSALMLLCWHQINPFQGELSVHSSELQMLQFLDSLLAYLPISCTVQPVKGTRGQDEVQIFSLALEKEVVSLRESVSLLLCKEEDNRRKSNDKTSEPGSVDSLQRCREEWHRDVERSKTELSPLVDVQRYRKLSQSLSKVQLEGDLAALLYTQ
uniref:FA complementation group B n=1 Tax=Sphaeramia orbicularis TaxID=375764 RepID=A0A673ASC8_9TELE